MRPRCYLPLITNHPISNASILDPLSNLEFSHRYPQTIFSMKCKGPLHFLLEHAHSRLHYLSVYLNTSLSARPNQPQIKSITFLPTFANASLFYFPAPPHLSKLCTTSLQTTTVHTGNEFTDYYSRRVRIFPLLPGIHRAHVIGLRSRSAPAQFRAITIG